MRLMLYAGSVRTVMDVCDGVRQKGRAAINPRAVRPHLVRLLLKLTHRDSSRELAELSGRVVLAPRNLWVAQPITLPRV